jgi:hypothetical protein
MVGVTMRSLVDWLVVIALVSVAGAVGGRIVEAGLLAAVRGRVAAGGAVTGAVGGYLMYFSHAPIVGVVLLALGAFTMLLAALSSGGELPGDTSAIPPDAWGDGSGGDAGGGL